MQTRPKLFPQRPRVARAGPPIGTGNGVDPFSPAELGDLKTCFLTRGTLSRCPRCRSVLTTVERPRFTSTGGVVWGLRCDSCGPALRLRVPPAARTAAVSSRHRSRSRNAGVGASSTSFGIAAAAHVGLVALIVGTWQPPVGPLHLASPHPTGRPASDTTLIYLAAPPRETVPSAATYQPRVARNEAGPPEVSLPPRSSAIRPVALAGSPDRLRFRPRTALPNAVRAYGDLVEAARRSAGGESEARRRRLFAVAELDQPPHLVAAPTLAYPEHLRVAGIVGQALVEFVVDSAGRVEAGSVRIREVTHPGFVRAIRDVIRHSRYSPGRISGTAVWTLVEERVVFSLPAAGRGGSVTVREPLLRGRLVNRLDDVASHLRP